eukprot:4938733-Alexandrium_andersonii.AAC.1
MGVWVHARVRAGCTAHGCRHHGICVLSFRAMPGASVPLLPSGGAVSGQAERTRFGRVAAR